MALIKCPECGKKISDRAASCPQCGCPIDSNSNQSEKRCPECGQSVSGFAEFCPNCGFPMNEDSQSYVSEKELNNTPKKKSLKLDWKSIGIVVFITCLIVGAVWFKQGGGNSGNRIKKELLGRWTYSGDRAMVVVMFFDKNGEVAVRQLSGINSFDGYGKYSVDGRNVYLNLSWNDGKEASYTFRLSEDHNLYASDGTKYIKVED